MWMRDVNGPSSVRQDYPISSDNLEDWLTLDMRVVFKWLSGVTQMMTVAEATATGAKRTTKVDGFAGKLDYLVAMAFAYTGDNISSSFCERINSVAKDILTQERTSLDPTELEMVAVLRINRTFMEYMKEKHPELVARFALAAADTASPAGQQASSSSSSTA